MPAAASFSSAAADLRRAEIPLRETFREVPRPSGAVVFVAGPLAADLAALGALIARCWPGVATLIATGSGVLSEREEIEGPGISGVLFSGGSAFVAAAMDAEKNGALDLLFAARSSAGDVVSAILAADPTRITSVLDAAKASLQGIPVLGGGVSGSTGTAVVTAAGDVRVGWLGVMLISRVARPRLIHSPAFKVLGAYARVTAVHQGMALELDSTPALDELSRRTRSLEDRPLVAAIFIDSAEVQDPIKEGRVRPIRGVDPERRAIAFVETVDVGQIIAIAARDPVTARADLNAVTRELARENAGAAPRFGLYFNCAGRGRTLYGASSVDATILRNQLGPVPIAGMMSSVEIATPRGGAPTIQFYTGVLALFSSPS